MESIRRIPIAVKLFYTAFVAVMVPMYWRAYGPQNFLFFCDVALLVTLVGMWLESPLLISTQAVGILLPQTLWLIDFAAGVFGFHPLNMTGYMFDAQYSLPLRGLSLFHGWLPILLVWLVARVGYDRRALVVQTVAGVTLLWICYFCFVPPAEPRTPRMFNLNYVFGLGDKPQTRMPMWAWFAVLLAGIPVLLYVPTHLILRAVFRPPQAISAAELPISPGVATPGLDQVSKPDVDQ